MTGNVINRRNARFLHIYIHTSISSPMNLSTWQTLPINSISISSRERERERPILQEVNISLCPPPPPYRVSREKSSPGRVEFLPIAQKEGRNCWQGRESRWNYLEASPRRGQTECLDHRYLPMKVRHRRFSSSPFHSFNPFSPRYFLFKEEFSSRILLAFFFKNIYRIKG